MATRRGAGKAKSKTESKPKADKPEEKKEAKPKAEAKPAKKAKPKASGGRVPEGKYVCCYTVTVDGERRRKGDDWEGTAQERDRLLKLGAIELKK